MGDGFSIVPTVAADQRAALEQLLYFNVNQERVRAGIKESIDRYGVPEILEKDGKLAIRVGRIKDVQTLFAVSRFGHPMGVAVFARVVPQRIVVLHVGVLPRLQSTSEAHTQVLLELVGEVFRLAKRTDGVDRVDVVYSQRRARSRARAAAALAGTLHR
jgi:hypothetical protein